MHRTLPVWISAGVVAAAGIVPVPPQAQVRAVQLANTAESPLGDGTALIMGPSGIPIPTQAYADAVDELYLQPRDFTGTTQILATPEGLYPITGVKSLELDPSVDQGRQILDAAIQNQTADAANPTVVFGFSQSSTVASQTMQDLADHHVPGDDVHFVLVGDPNAPNGGLLERFNVPIDGHSPSVPSLGITFNGATPDDLYPTDIYSTEYDGFADFPRYPIDLLSDLNALLGILFEHTAYLGLTPDQIASAVELPTSTTDTLTDYYMVPADSLPLLAPLQLIPGIGQPLYDLYEPDMRILVNLGYGSIDHGWDPGPADVPTTFDLFPTDLDWGEVATALVNGAQQGISNAIEDLLDPANYQAPALDDIPFLQPLLNSAAAFGFDLNGPLNELLKAGLDFIGFPFPGATLASSPTDIIDDLTAVVSADYATLLPVADTVTALLTTLPAIGASFIADQLADGDLLGAIGEPIAALTGLLPFALFFGVGAPVLEAAGGTLANLVELFDL
jgi:hypothetical protein